MELKAVVNDLRIYKNRLIGDVEYVPFGIYVQDYEFTKGDVVIVTDDECYMLIDENKLFDIANVY